MTLNLQAPGIHELKPRITVFGCGGAGGNAVNNMIESGLIGVDFVVANTDAQALTMSKAERRIQMGLNVTQGLGAGAHPEIGRAAAEEVIDEIRDQLSGAHMVFITAGMGGGSGTGGAPVVARVARELGILTVGVVTKPFHFEGQRRMRVAEGGIGELQQVVDTLIVIPNQNLFRVANEKTTFADAFAMADQVLYSGVASITDLMVKEGLINLDFADVRSVMREMGKAMMGTGEATGEKRAITAAEAAIANPLLDETSMKGARGLLISISGGRDMTLYEVDEAANRVKQEVDEEANVIFGATFDENLDGVIRVSVVATGIDRNAVPHQEEPLAERRIAEITERLAAEARARQAAAVARAQASVQQAAVQQSAHYAPSQHGAVSYGNAAPAPVMPQPATVAPRFTPVVEQPVPTPLASQPVPLPVQAEPTYAPAPVVETPLEATLTVSVPQPVDMVADAPFIAPAVDRGVLRAPRMPSVEDLPAPVQQQLRAARAPVAPAAPAPVEAKRMSLLDRLKAVGLASRREEEAPIPAATPGVNHADYARRPAAPPAGARGQLDQHGRTPPATRSLDDEQLEIPAFLRRQAN